MGTEASPGHTGHVERMRVTGHVVAATAVALLLPVRLLLLLLLWAGPRRRRQQLLEWLQQVAVLLQRDGGRPCRLGQGG